MKSQSRSIAIDKRNWMDEIARRQRSLRVPCAYLARAYLLRVKRFTIAITLDNEIRLAFAAIEKTKEAELFYLWEESVYRVFEERRRRRKRQLQTFLREPIALDAPAKRQQRCC